MISAVIGILPLGTIFVRKGCEVILFIILIAAGIAVFIRYGGYVISGIIRVERCRLVPVLDTRRLV